MSLVSLTAVDGVALLRLQDGVTNPISPEMLHELGDCLDQVRRNFQGMVLAGGSKFFSMGLNLPQLLAWDRQEFSRFFQQFQDVLWELLTLPLPTASAICGHAIAGGTIFALMTDYRYLADGKTLMGVNEIKLGLTVPYLADLRLGQLLPANQAKEMIYSGEFVGPAQAEAMGLVDALCPPEDCEQTALHKIGGLARHPAAALAAMKQNNRLETITDRYQANQEREAERFVELWFSPQTRELLEQAAKKF